MLIIAYYNKSVSTFCILFVFIYIQAVDESDIFIFLTMSVYIKYNFAIIQVDNLTHTLETAS